MLVAIDAGGRRHTASAALAVPVFCPDCGRPLLVRVPASKVPHFAHRPRERCSRSTLRRERARARRVQAQRAALAAQVESGQQTLFDLEVAPADTA